MARIDPALVPVVFDLARGLRDLRVPFGVVGALVPELLLDARPPRMTNDADVTVVAESHDDFERIKDRLGDFGFTRTRLPHRMRHRDGGLLNIIPYSEAIAPQGRLDLGGDFVFNMAGFGQVVPNTISVSIEGGPTLPLTPLPLHVLLKLVAFSDRKEPKDLAGVLHCLEHYLEDDDGRYGLDHAGEAVPFEYTCAHLVGLDGRQFLDRPVTDAVRPVLDRFESPDADIVGIVARERWHFLVEDEHRTEIFEMFRWFRLGSGI